MRGSNFDPIPRIRCIGKRKFRLRCQCQAQSISRQIHILVFAGQIRIQKSQSVLRVRPHQPHIDTGRHGNAGPVADWRDDDNGHCLGDGQLDHGGGTGDEVERITLRLDLVALAKIHGFALGVVRQAQGVDGFNVVGRREAGDH